MKGGETMNQINQIITDEVCIGLDTHKESIHGTAVTKDGKLICSYKFKNNRDSIKEFIKPFSQWNTHFALEACGTWRGCYHTLKNNGFNNIKLANPYKCHQIAKDKKTDKIDSKILADLLRVGYLPEVFIPSDEILKLRDLTRHKCNLTRLKTSIKVKIKMDLLREGIIYEDKLWNAAGLNWLVQQKNDRINGFLEIYKTIEHEEKYTNKKISSIVKNKKELTLLKTIPGIGDYGAALIYAEIADISRFSTPKYLHAYAGFIPGIYQSGSKTRTVKKRELNHWLKWIVGECTGRAIMQKCKCQRYYFKIKRIKGWKTARKATARRMLTIIWNVLKNQEPYHEL